MISRTHRFHGRAGIRRLQLTGTPVRSGQLALRYVPNPKISSYRLAIVVSRRVSKSAVVRNRIRRRLYESVRILSSSFTAPYDLVIVAYDEQIADMPAVRLEGEVKKLLKKARLTSSVSVKRAIVEPKNIN